MEGVGNRPTGTGWPGPKRCRRFALPPQSISQPRLLECGGKRQRHAAFSQERSHHRTMDPAGPGGARLLPSCSPLLPPSGSGSESASIFPFPPLLSGAPSSCEACPRASSPWMNPRQRVSPTGSARTPQGWEAGPAAYRRRLRGPADLDPDTDPDPEGRKRGRHRRSAHPSPPHRGWELTQGHSPSARHNPDRTEARRMASDRRINVRPSGIGTTCGSGSQSGPGRRP